jgi:hypothetical protein
MKVIIILRYSLHQNLDSQNGDYEDYCLLGFDNIYFGSCLPVFLKTSVNVHFLSCLNYHNYYYYHYLLDTQDRNTSKFTKFEEFYLL